MQTINSLSEHVKISVPMSGLDIGATSTDAIATGTDAELHWFDMTEYGNLLVYGQLGTATESDWTASDDIATITIQQASSATGTGVKTLKAFTVTAGDLDAKGNSFTVEIQSNELDIANDFTHVRAKVAATDNGGVDELNVVYVGYNPRYSNDARDSYSKQYPSDQSAD